MPQGLVTLGPTFVRRGRRGTAAVALHRRVVGRRDAFCRGQSSNSSFGPTPASAAPVAPDLPPAIRSSTLSDRPTNCPHVADPAEIKGGNSWPTGEPRIRPPQRRQRVPTCTHWKAPPLPHTPNADSICCLTPSTRSISRNCIRRSQTVDVDPARLVPPSSRGTSTWGKRNTCLPPFLPSMSDPPTPLTPEIKFPPRH